MAKNAIQKIEEHEKLCRIMQKQTHDKIHKLERNSTPSNICFVTSIS